MGLRPSRHAFFTCRAGGQCRHPARNHVQTCESCHAGRPRANGAARNHILFDSKEGNTMKWTWKSVFGGGLIARAAMMAFLGMPGTMLLTSAASPALAQAQQQQP